MQKERKMVWKALVMKWYGKCNLDASMGLYMLHLGAFFNCPWLVKNAYLIKALCAITRNTVKM